MDTLNNKHSKIFKALSDEKRLYILELLRNGSICACEILEKVDIGQSSLSYHMKVLTESGIVESKQVGKWTYYNISEMGSRNALSVLTQITKINPNSKSNNCCNSEKCL